LPGGGHLRVAFRMLVWLLLIGTLTTACNPCGRLYKKRKKKQLAEQQKRDQATDSIPKPAKFYKFRWKKARKEVDSIMQRRSNPKVNRGFDFNYIEYMQLECLGCETVVIAELTRAATDLKTQLENKRMFVEIWHEDYTSLIQPSEIYYAPGSASTATFVFRFKTHRPGMNKYGLHVSDINQYGSKLLFIQNQLNIKVVPVPRIIDTAKNPCWPCLLTVAQPGGASDTSTVSARDSLVLMPTSTIKGFNVSMDSANVLTKRGKKLRNGFRKYYLQVVSAKQVRVEGARIRKASPNAQLFVAAVSSKPRPPGYIPETKQKKKRKTRTYESRALFIKAIEDDTAKNNCDLDSLRRYVKYRYKLYKKLFKARTRRVQVGKTKKGKPRYGKRSSATAVEIIAANFVQAKYKEVKEYSRFKKKFIRAKRNPRKLARFFLRRNFTRRNLKYNIRPMPYGLPKLRTVSEIRKDQRLEQQEKQRLQREQDERRLEQEKPQPPLVPPATPERPTPPRPEPDDDDDLDLLDDKDD
jgi:hypothetical protein